MFVLLFLISLSSDTCHSQYVYGGIVPYDPRYAVRRPVRRSAIEALERLRLPVARYFPQVDTQVASAPFPWRPSDMYALPAQWSDEYVPTVEEDETTDYGNYDYENAYRPQPVYAEEVYPQEVEPEMPEGGPLYNDLMSSYLMEVPERPEMFENVQRRSGVAEPVHLDRVLEANEKASGTTAVSTTSAPSPSTTTQASQQQVQIFIRIFSSNHDSLALKQTAIKPQQHVSSLTKQKQKPYRTSKKLITFSYTDVTSLKSHSSSEADDPEWGQELGRCPGSSAGGADQSQEEAWRLKTWTPTDFFRF
ncbi:hypothetical protein HNY73_009747 [Argiope bruennichi]|uniref:Uncharacterized protein n=1 Tax=Argiope bruennichi TaxID=94029 RepID=A0A8T0FAL4_ARGBR|nr:hypothetical protein HNY73_009747 [Argiope bruennichi]